MATRAKKGDPLAPSKSRVWSEKECEWSYLSYSIYGMIYLWTYYHSIRWTQSYGSYQAWSCPVILYIGIGRKRWDTEGNPRFPATTELLLFLVLSRLWKTLAMSNVHLPPLECTLNATTDSQPVLMCIKVTGVYFPRKRPIDRYPVRVRGIVLKHFQSDNDMEKGPVLRPMKPNNSLPSVAL